MLFPSDKLFWNLVTEARKIKTAPPTRVKCYLTGYMWGWRACLWEMGDKLFAHDTVVGVLRDMGFLRILK